MKINEVLPNDIFTECHRKLFTGHRLISMVFAARGVTGDITLKYLFISGSAVECVEIRTHAKSTVQSISSLCGSAGYFENEIRDMTGIYFDGLEQDYGRRFLLSGEVIESVVE
jgi:NADH:ubiquinone oxidoreductase subunit C